jgi:hypothetical protein
MVEKVLGGELAEDPQPWPEPPTLEEVEAAMAVLSAFQASVTTADSKGYEYIYRLRKWHAWEADRLNYGWGPQSYDWLDAGS